MKKYLLAALLLVVVVSIPAVAEQNSQMILPEAGSTITDLIKRAEKEGRMVHLYTTAGKFSGKILALATHVVVVKESARYSEDIFYVPLEQVIALGINTNDPR